MPSLSRIIDVHSHAILNIGRGAPAAKLPDWSVESALQYMEEHDIAACVLSVPDAANYATAADARDIARRINETLAGIVSRHPARFGALATIPAQHPDIALGEIAHALDALGLDGVATSTSIGDTYLGEPAFDPWLEELNRRGAVLFIHPTMTTASMPLGLGLNPSVIEFMFDTTRMLTNLVVTGAKTRFSKVRMISNHGGGTIPFLVERIMTLEHTFGVGPGRLELSPADIQAAFASFYFDLTASTSAAQLNALLELVPVSNLLMGLDLPFMPGPSYGAAIAAVGRSPRLDAADLEAISHGNAARLFPALAGRIERGA